MFRLEITVPISDEDAKDDFTRWAAEVRWKRLWWLEQHIFTEWYNTNRLFDGWARIGLHAAEIFLYINYILLIIACGSMIVRLTLQCLHLI